MKAICKEDIKSSKGNIYAPKGAEIEVYSQRHSTVWLCEYKGNKFPVNPNKLEYDTKRNGSETSETGVEYKPITSIK